MLFTFLKKYNEKILFPLRYAHLTRKLTPYLQNKKHVLDIGASNGKLASLLIKKNKHLKIQGVDTLIVSPTFIPIEKYEGKKLPFADSTFDTSMIVDVLHHDKEIEKLLQEAKRVAKKYIIIKDHFYHSKIDWNLLKWSDWIGNRPYDIALPYNYQTIMQWHTLFKRLHLKIVREERFRYSAFDTTQHVIFLLEK